MKQEQGLSEVIGFLMIIALLGILFSMYLLYVVPIQGKDAEISHMKYVSQQFIDLKSDIDSLIINERVNVPIARSFELGTLSSTGQGSLSILPIQGFIEAAGTLVVNQQMDTLQIQGVFQTSDMTSVLQNLVSPPENKNIPAQWIEGDHLYINYPGIDSINNTVNGTVFLVTTNSSIISNVTNTTTTKDYYGDYVIRPKTRYELNKTFNFVLETGEDPYITNPDNSTEYDPDIIWWTINKTDPARNTTDYVTYKPKTDIIFEFYNKSTLRYTRTLQENATAYPHIFDLSKINEIISTNPNLLEFNLAPKFTNAGGMNAPKWQFIRTEPQPLGSLQYWSQNRYWINQELLYEMGGLFLKQSEGVSIMLIPSLSVTPIETTDGINITVSLVDVSITDTNDVSGSKSAQIFAKVDSVIKNQLKEMDHGMNLITHSITPEQPNTKFLVITFKPENPKDKTTTRLWKRAFDQVYVITQKTMSERQVSYDIANSMITLYDEDPLSASLFIGYNIQEHLIGVDAHLQAWVDRLTACANDLSDKHTGGGHPGCVATEPLKPFYFDYSKAKVSLVIQSGAL